VVAPRVTGPPEATLSRRSQSYSDFHDAVQTVLGVSVVKAKAPTQQESSQEIRTELDFLDWYNGLEHGLLDASHEEYRSVESPLLLPRSFTPSLYLL
jgi:hypothetical protein